MLSKIIPQEGRFFDLFEESADLIVRAAQEFRKMLDELPQAEKYTAHIEELEHKADTVTHRTVEMLHKTFITPIDRDDIHELISKMDDILDFIEAAAQRIFQYDVTQVTPETFKLADICIQCAEYVKKAVQGLSNLKNPQEMIKNCVELNRLENEADFILRGAMAKLFREETDLRQLIKLKEILELLETVTDRCEDVANIIEGIVLEYA